MVERGGEDERALERRRLASALRARRHSLGWSRREVADRSGLSYPYVSQLENGDREPSLKALSALAGAFGVQVEELVAGGGSMPGSPLTGEAAAPRLSTAEPVGWLSNPAYSGEPARSPRSPSRSRRLDVAIDDAYAVLAQLPVAQRVDAAGALLARCLADQAHRSR